MNIDVLKKCKELRLQDFENSEVYNILGRAEMEGQADEGFKNWGGISRGGISWCQTTM